MACVFTIPSTVFLITSFGVVYVVLALGVSSLVRPPICYILSPTGKLSKKVHSHTRKLSKRNYGSQPYRKIVKLHFEMIFCRKTHLKLGVIYEVRHIKGMAIHDNCQLGNQEK